MSGPLRAGEAPLVPLPAAYAAVCVDLSEGWGSDAARRVCRRCLELSPGDAACKAALREGPGKSRHAAKEKRKNNLLEDLCVTSFQNGDLVKAADFCRQCLEADPSDAPCFATQKMVGSKLPKDAPPRSLQAFPLPESRGANPHYVSGVVFFQNGDYVKAQKEWEACIHAEPGNPDCAAGLERLSKVELK